MNFQNETHKKKTRIRNTGGDGSATLHDTWFSDEAYFNLDGTVRKQNVRFG
jgi:hypothetical protein